MLLRGCFSGCGGDTGEMMGPKKGVEMCHYAKRVRLWWVVTETVFQGRNESIFVRGIILDPKGLII